MEYWPQALGVAVWFAGSFALMHFIAVREARADANPDSELARAEKIARHLGAWTILLLLGLAFLVSLGSGIWVFVGLATGDNYLATARMAAVLAVSLPSYFYLERISKALGRR